MSQSGDAPSRAMQGDQIYSAHPRLLEDFATTKDGVQIEVLRSPDLNVGVPMLFIPGMLGTASMFAERVEVIRPRPGIAFSHRGCGKSSSPQEGHFDFLSRCLDIEAIVDHFQLPRYILYGFSRGVSMAVEHALQFPNRVAGLVLDDAEAIYPELDRGWLHRVLTAQFLWANPFALEQIQKESREIDLTNRLDEIKVPVLIVRGEQESSLLSRLAAERMKKKLSNAKLIHLPQSGHGASPEDFPDFRDALEEFCNQIDPDAG